MKKLLFLVMCITVCSTLLAQVTPTESGKLWLEEDSQSTTLYIVYPLKGIAAYDITDAGNPETLGFIELEGVIDLAVRGSLIFANQYQDLVAITVDWEANSYDELSREEDVFPNRIGSDKEIIQIASSEAFEAPGFIASLPPNSTRPILDGAPASSIQGSMSCLALKGNSLYAINENELMTFNTQVSSEDFLERSNSTKPGTNDLETVYISENGLYIGSQTGMYIYDIASDKRDAPQFVGRYQHTRSCDPVFVKGNTAYITMRDGRDCRGGFNQLAIVDITNPRIPRSIVDYPMTNPHGLSLNNNGLLFVCDGRAGLRILDVTNTKAIQEIRQISGLSTYDVIYSEGQNLGIISTTEGWKLYNMRRPKNPNLLSEISIQR